MDIEKKAYLAIDTAYQTGAVILFMNNEVLFSRELAEKMAHGKEICQAIDDAMNHGEAVGATLAGVFVGLGPGSFVGVRITVATALGFAFAKNLSLIGICSHEALAWSTAKTAGNFYVFMKASGDLGYAARYSFLHDQIYQMEKTVVVSVGDFLETVNDGEVVYSDVAEKLALARPYLQVECLLGPTTNGLMHAAINRMASPLVDESDIIKPNYIKPPNVSLPKKSFICHRSVN